jgi:hypothetical protein
MEDGLKIPGFQVSGRQPGIKDIRKVGIRQRKKWE